MKIYGIPQARHRVIILGVADDEAPNPPILELKQWAEGSKTKGVQNIRLVAG